MLKKKFLEKGAKAVKRWGFTLLEIMIVIVVIGVLLTIAINHFGVLRESNLVREAIATLRVIKATETAAHLERGVYVACPNDGVNTACSTALRLDLQPNHPIGALDSGWTYSVALQGTGFRAIARRRWSGGVCRYFITDVTRDPSQVVGSRCVAP